MDIFVIILIIILVIFVLGSVGLVLKYYKKNEKPSVLGESLEAHNQKMREDKAVLEEKIMELLEDLGRIDNYDIETKFKVSDATATRYLAELEAQGKIKQVGETGRSVYYEKR